MLTTKCKLIARGCVGIVSKSASPKPRTCSSSVKVLKSVYGEVDVPEQTLSQFVFADAHKWRDLPALTCGVSGRSYTYGMIQQLCQRGAQALLANTDLKPGDRIGLLLPNVPEFTLAVHASLQAGLVVTYANPLFTVHELTRQFSSAKVRCIVTVPQLLELAQAVAKSLPAYDCTINVGGEPSPQNKILGLESLTSTEKKVDLPEVRSSDIAVLPYSSGTTGVPKGVMLSHRNLVVNIMQLLHPQLVEETDPLTFQDVSLTVLPFFHIYGFNAILNYLAKIGSHLVSMPKFTPQDYIKCLLEYQPTVLFVVPSLLLFLITHPEVTPRHLASVNKIFCGAAPLKKGLIDRFYEKIGRTDCTITQGYGMTETSPGITITPYNMPYSKSGSCGRLLPSTLARVIDLSDGHVVGVPNRPGELLVKGPQVMQGYLDNPGATSDVIDTHGWFHTGDVVYYDEDEYFYIIDRTKELIKVKGNQVSPTELESLLLEIPGVADAAVVGIPDSFAGELPKAFIVRKPGFDDMTVDSVQDFVTPKVATYKKLAGGVEFVEVIPRNPSGKILRNELKNLCSQN
ncbi:unnamed protein product [Trichogramma brassicae]|uniref:Luciferin 4-monooxygenase n=1 Tax=Trichogramma brassicae TaxID=86971 RepID=A0A6H5I8S2_9HYME|nr:unnamed protein product [Trichogramma brassicae]